MYILGIRIYRDRSRRLIYLCQAKYRDRDRSKIWLSQNFFMKDLGDAMYILGIRIYRNRSRRLISLCQGKYIEKILKKFNMWNFKRGFIPFRHEIHLSKSMSPKTYDERERMNKIPLLLQLEVLCMLCYVLDWIYLMQ